MGLGRPILFLECFNLVSFEMFLGLPPPCNKLYCMSFCGKRKCFKNEIDAAKCFDEKSWELLHDLSKLNFPENYENKGVL